MDQSDAVMEDSTFGTGGEVDPEVLAEFPGLSVVSVGATLPNSKTPRGLAEQLDFIANRIRGATAVRSSTESVAAAYRGFVRQLGMDPERVLGTVEAVTIRRLIEGGFASAGLAADAAALATIEFGVPLTILDAANVNGPIDILKAVDSSGFHAVGDLVLADCQQPVSRIFGEPFPEFRAGKRVKAVRLVAIAIQGVEPGLVRAALERSSELISDS